MQQIIELMKELAVQAGNVIMEVYSQPDFAIKIKQDGSPLTQADQLADDLISTGLKAAFPEYGILSEETGKDSEVEKADYCFIVDPLDGTKEFIHRRGDFTVNIALAYRHKVIAGVIYIPVTQRLYFAIQGLGAFVEDLGTCSTPARITVTDKIDHLVVVGSKSHASVKESELVSLHHSQIHDVISVGSSLKGCLVAEGQADVYYRFGLTSEWDTAAMQAIIEEAGGIFRQMDGSKMTYVRSNHLNELGFYVVNRPENIWV